MAVGSRVIQFLPVLYNKLSLYFPNPKFVRFEPQLENRQSGGLSSPRRWCAQD